MKEHVAVNSKKDQVVLTPTSLKVWDISDRMTKQIAKRAFQLFEVTILLRMIKTGGESQLFLGIGRAASSERRIALLPDAGSAMDRVSIYLRSLLSPKKEQEVTNQEIPDRNFN